MFKLPDPNATWKVPVTVRVPGDGVAPEEHEFTAHFRWLERSALKELVAGEDDLAFFKSVLAGFEGIDDHAGEPLPFNDDSMTVLVEIPYFARAVVDTYLTWHQGLPIKN